MDLSCTKINLHPQAAAFLFQHFQVTRRIFNDVLGHLEIDYMGIALLNPKNELLFLSSKPSFEQNLIENNIWAFDGSYSTDFFIQGKAHLWEDLYHDEWREMLHLHKQKIPGFSMGIAVPSIFEEYRVVYSFALKSTNTAIKKEVLNQIETLTCMGRYCLQNIMKKIPLPDQKNIYVSKKPSLTLIINNKVHHENNT